MLGQEAAEEAAEEAADAARRDIDTGHRGRVGGKFLADIGDRDGEDRRQQQALDEAPEHQRAETRATRPTIAVGTTSANIAATMRRLRPSASATAPVKGAMSATAKVEALTVRLTAAGVASNSRAAAAAAPASRRVR